MEMLLRTLADDHRRTVLEELRVRPATVNELAAVLPIARPGVSRHLRVLREAGLVEVRRDAQRRIYSLRPEPLAELDAWLNPYRALWHERMGALHEEIARVKSERKGYPMSNHVQPASPVRGSVHADGDGRGTVRMESVFNTAPDDLWSALTEPPRLARWIANVDGDLRVGGTFSASFTSGWEGPGRVDACVPPKRLLVALDPGTSDETAIEATLSPEGGGTRLVVEERGIPLDEISAHGAGWQVHMEDLSTYLSGGEPSGWRTRWIELTPAYEDLTHALE